MNIASLLSNKNAAFLLNPSLLKINSFSVFTTATPLLHASRISLQYYRAYTNDTKLNELSTIKTPVRVRFAPSPTGSLHLGGLRTALYNYLFAKKHKGKFILRIEDTDAKRLVPGALQKIMSTLHAAGIHPDEETLDSIRQTAVLEGRIPVYDKRCRKLTPSQIEKNIKENKNYTIRLKCPSDTNKFTDHVYGTITMGMAQQDDAILLKSDGSPTYHLAHPVDDHLMEISHVFRGEEWLSSTPKHLAIFKALGWNPPKYVHLPLIFGHDKKKLSKRTGTADFDSYIKKGYLPESIINFLAFLGWAPKNSKTELNSIDQLADMFVLSDINKSNPILYSEKLDWFNNQYIVKSLSTDEQIENQAKLMSEYIKTHLNLQSEPVIESVISALKLCKNELFFYNDIAKVANYFFVHPDYDYSQLSSTFKDILPSKKESIALAIKSNVMKYESFTPDLSSEVMDKSVTWTKIAKTVSKDLGISLGVVNRLMRYIITGKMTGPSLNPLMAAIGITDVLKRIDIFINFLQKNQ
ncbi:hypothetical protein BB561_004942 [Smittium simulii]|uniref:glutamate--tRNA ligase n=1 Tax=Smittium simulii TaxID=133385 RepID=A0A2T9YD90_9FUNG|nr:hypothetical protein BB561_004942 [Smittium simulii]